MELHRRKQGERMKYDQVCRSSMDYEMVERNEYSRCNEVRARKV